MSDVYDPFLFSGHTDNLDFEYAVIDLDNLDTFNIVWAERSICTGEIHVIFFSPLYCYEARGSWSQAEPNFTQREATKISQPSKIHGKNDRPISAPTSCTVSTRSSLSNFPQFQAIPRFRLTIVSETGHVFCLNSVSASKPNYQKDMDKTIIQPDQAANCWNTKGKYRSGLSVLPENVVITLLSPHTSPRSCCLSHASSLINAKKKWTKKNLTRLRIELRAADHNGGTCQSNMSGAFYCLSEKNT